MDAAEGRLHGGSSLWNDATSAIPAVRQVRLANAWAVTSEWFDSTRADHFKKGVAKCLIILSVYLTLVRVPHVEGN